MKHIKKFESLSERDQLMSDVAWYLEDQQPVSKEEGFIECEFDPNELFCFVFEWQTSEESYDKFYAFLKENKLKIIDELSYRDKYEIQIKVSKNKIKEFASLYNSTQKYNL